MGNLRPNVLYTCETCGSTVAKYIVPSRQSRTPARFCDRTCAGKWRKGANHPRWNGGRYRDKEGYVYVLTPEHPHGNKDGAVFEHRLVMEAYLGRYLGVEEVVHHENDEPGDNRIGNLRLFANQSEHKRYHEQGRQRDGSGRYVAV